MRNQIIVLSITQGYHQYQQQSPGRKDAKDDIADSVISDNIYSKYSNTVHSVITEIQILKP